MRDAFLSFLVLLGYVAFWVVAFLSIGLDIYKAFFKVLGSTRLSTTTITTVMAMTLMRRRPWIMRVC
jgi:hypothetical protein